MLTEYYVVERFLVRNANRIILCMLVFSCEILLWFSINLFCGEILDEKC